MVIIYVLRAPLYELERTLPSLSSTYDEPKGGRAQCRDFLV